MACINRTTNKLNETTYHVYPNNGAQNYKKDDGTYEPIDLTFEDTSTSIGDISLNRKNVFSTGIRKDKNPYKMLGIRPDNCQDGSKQIEFSVDNVKINNIDGYDANNFDIQVTNNELYKLYKNDGFKTFELAFKIHLTGVTIVNDKVTENKVIRDKVEVEFINAGQDTGINLINTYLSDPGITSTNKYLRLYCGQVTDDFIIRFDSTDEEEFGDADVSNYSFYDMAGVGSHMYLKNSVGFYALGNNIDNFRNFVIENICNQYGFTYTDRYFLKDGKKVGSYIIYEDKVLGHINTEAISDTVKTLFIRKTFNETTYKNLTLSEFDIDIKEQFDYAMDSVEIDTNFYDGDIFEIKINNNSYFIDTPKIMDSNKLIISNRLDTTHTLKDNQDGTYTYTKYLTPIGVFKCLGSEENYIDVNVTSTSADQVPYHLISATNVPNNTASNLNTMRTIVVANNDQVATTNRMCGGLKSSATSTSSGLTTTTRTYEHHQRHMQFDVSSISNATAVKFRSVRTCIKTVPTIGGGIGSYDGIKVQYCKSTNTNTNTTSSDIRTSYNDFTGHSTSSWDETDTTNYSSVISIPSGTMPSSGTFSEDTLNSTALTDINNDSTFRMCFMEYEEFHQGNHDLANWNTGTFGGTSSKFYEAINARSSSFNSSYATSDIKHLEITVPAAATPTDNSIFFSTNF